MAKVKLVTFSREVRIEDCPYFYMVCGDVAKISFVLKSLIGRSIEHANPKSNVVISLSTLECKPKEQMRVRSQLYNNFAMSELALHCGTHEITFTIDIASSGPGIDKSKLKANLIDMSTLETCKLPPANGIGYGLTVFQEHATQMGWKINIDCRPGVGTKYTLRCKMSCVYSVQP